MVSFGGWFTDYLLYLFGHQQYSALSKVLSEGPSCGLIRMPTPTVAWLLHGGRRNFVAVCAATADFWQGEAVSLRAGQGMAVAALRLHLPDIIAPAAER